MAKVKTKDSISRETAIKLLQLGEIDTFSPERLVLSGLSKEPEGPLYSAPLGDVEAHWRRVKEVICYFTREEANRSIQGFHEESRVTDLTTLDWKLELAGIKREQLHDLSADFSGSRLYGPGTISDIWKEQYVMNLGHIEKIAGMSFQDAQRLPFPIINEAPVAAQPQPPSRNLCGAHL